ncbi:MAG: hypothetical protein AAGA67_07270 [Cyanobacteria bacterium P01_F01_bin.153]
MCSFSQLPDPYRCAFQQGSAHHLPGQFLPAQVDWSIQIFTLLFGLIYGLPLLTLPPVLLSELVRSPEGFVRFFQALERQSTAANALLLGLFILLGALLIYCALIAWNGGLSFIRTWQAHRLQKRGKHGFGLALLEKGIVARLINNIDERNNCIWLPREAIVDILWQRVREQGVRNYRWVYRTQLCYVAEHQGKPQTYWLTLRGDIIQTGYPAGEGNPRCDRFLFDQLYNWWQTPEPPVVELPPEPPFEPPSGPPPKKQPKPRKTPRGFG